MIGGRQCGVGHILSDIFHLGATRYILYVAEGVTMAKLPLILTALLALVVLSWTVSVVGSGPPNPTSGIDRTSQGYQSIDLSANFNQVVTNVEQLIYAKNQTYARFWSAKRILAGVAALVGVFVVGLGSNSTNVSRPIQIATITCGLIAAICPPAVSYLSTAAEDALVGAKDLKSQLDGGLAAVRLKPASEPDVIIELNALAIRYGAKPA